MTKSNIAGIHGPSVMYREYRSILSNMIHVSKQGIKSPQKLGYVYLLTVSIYRFRLGTLWKWQTMCVP